MSSGWHAAWISKAAAGQRPETAVPCPSRPIRPCRSSSSTKARSAPRSWRRACARPASPTCVRIAGHGESARPHFAVDPDVILIDLENPSRDVLEQMFQVSRVVRRPIAMFVDQSDTASIQAVGRCRRLRLHRRRPEEGAHQVDPRSVHLALQRVRAAAGRARADQDRARRAQGHRPRQGHPDEAQEPDARRRPTRCCARPP